MAKNLTWKLVVILGILLLFVVGIFGAPWQWAGRNPLTLITDRIHLGLDLKGGMHLILQVQVNDAVNVDSDNVVTRLKDTLGKRNIHYADITKPDPVNNPDKIAIKGVGPESASDLRSIVSDTLPEYD